MSITIQASFQNGVLQPDEPLALNENEKVTIVVTRAGSRIQMPPDNCKSRPIQN